MQNNFYKKTGKRLFDFTSSVLGLLLLSPLFLFVFVWIKISSKGNGFFIQKRVGRNFSNFNLYKFRTMVSDAHKLDLEITTGDDLRITKVGNIIRKYKIDELPQLLNVIKGDMSLVGPRPEVEKYVNTYKNKYSKILSIRPGITDLASFKYRNENELLKGIENTEEYYINTILADKVKLNIQYLSDIKFSNDLKIIFKTIFSS